MRSKNMKKHINELDYLKCIFIMLMVVFHLSYINDKYPYLKQIVYTFHMPAFLLISGYLTNIYKNSGTFFIGILWIFIPYFVMELGYICMSAILPVRDKVECLSFPLIVKFLFLHPIGPYWYLHTLIVCSTIYYLIFKYLNINKISLLILVGLSYFMYRKPLICCHFQMLCIFWQV